MWCKDTLNANDDYDDTTMIMIFFFLNVETGKR